MGSHGALRDDQRGRDAPVRPAFDEQAEELQLAAGLRRRLPGWDSTTIAASSAVRRAGRPSTMTRR